MSSAYIAGKQTQGDRIHTISEHVHSHGLVYPTLAAGVTVAGAAAAWTLGNFVELVPVNTITRPFDFHWINLEDASDEDVYELHFFAGTVEISRLRFSVTLNVGNKVILPPFPCLMEIQPANTQIQMKVASAGGGAEDITISAEYHTY